MQIFKKEIHLKKTNLIEMIIYCCITEKLNKKEVQGISINHANQILNKNNIKVKSLPGCGNINLKEKEIKPFVEEKSFIKI